MRNEWHVILLRRRRRRQAQGRKIAGRWILKSLSVSISYQSQPIGLGGC